MADTPEGCQAHAENYKPQAWEEYSFDELGHWVHLLAKRAEHRACCEKKTKDLTDAQNYLDMMQSKLDQLKNGGSCGSC